MSIDKFDIQYLKKFTLHDVAKSLVEDKEKNLTKEEEFERHAMLFSEDFNFDEIPDWGTYHGPFNYRITQEGYGEFPSIQNVDSSMIQYFEKRADETNNTILRTRYLALIWDFKKIITDEDPDYRIGISYIESILDYIKNDYSNDPYDYVIKAKRAISIAKSLNQKKLLDSLKDEIIRLENEGISHDGFALETLITEKVIIDPVIEAEILKNLEDKLDSEIISAKSKKYPWRISRIGKKLAIHYRKTGNVSKAKSIIKKVGEAIINIGLNESGNQGSSFLEHVNELYTDFQLNSENAELLPKLRTKQKDIELSEFIFEENVDHRKVDTLISSVFDENIKHTIFRIAHKFVPQKENLEFLLKELKKDPINLIFSRTNLDEEGRTLAKLGTIVDDEEGHLMNELCSTFKRSNIFMHFVFNQLIETGILESVELNELITESTIIDEDRIPIIKEAINFYLKKNYLVCMSLLIPQIEDMIRNIVENLGGSVLKRTRSGSYHLKTFDSVLRSEEVQSVFDENFIFYLRTIYTDQRGLNLRNDLCHGNLKLYSFNEQNANRVIHSLFVLLLLREKKTDNIS